MVVPGDAQPLIGLLLAERYRIDEFLGEGYFSFVFRARDIVEERDVAIKLLRPVRTSQESIIEMDTERELLRKLVNRNHIPDCYVGEEHVLQLTLSGSTIPFNVTLHFIAMELADGCLMEIVAFRDVATWAQKLRLFRSVVKGLHQTHISDVVHRDLKADNVLLFEQQSQPDTKICDFGRGVAVKSQRRFAPDVYKTGRGHLLFAPPEFLWEIGSVDPDDWRRSDLYLLGSVLFELATGQQLTSFVGPAVRAQAKTYLGLSTKERRSEFQARVAELVSLFEPAWALFEAELPPPIRQEGSQLIRQLTAPDPRDRRPLRPFRREHRWDLTWVLHRVDIMLKILEKEAAQQRRLNRRKKAS